MKFSCPTREAVEMVAQRENVRVQDLNEDQWRLARAFSNANRVEQNIRREREEKKAVVLPVSVATQMEEKRSSFDPIRIHTNERPTKCQCWTKRGDRCNRRLKGNQTVCGIHAQIACNQQRKPLA